MTRTTSGTQKVKLAHAVKISVLLAMVLSALFLVYFTELTARMNSDSLRILLDRTGSWSPVAFIILYTTGVLLFIPGPLLAGVGAAIFGPYWGFLYVYLGAMMGGTTAFLLGRWLGREFAASLAGRRLRRYDEAIERNGFATVLYLRLIYSPYSPMSFGMGLTKVRFWPYFLATALGIFAGTFILTFSIGTFTEVWMSGQWEKLLTPRVFLSLGLFFISPFIPLLVKRVRKRRKAPLSP